MSSTPSRDDVFVPDVPSAFDLDLEAFRTKPYNGKNYLARGAYEDALAKFYAVHKGLNGLYTPGDSPRALFSRIMKESAERNGLKVTGGEYGFDWARATSPPEYKQETPATQEAPKMKLTVKEQETLVRHLGIRANALWPAIKAAILADGCKIDAEFRVMDAVYKVFNDFPEQYYTGGGVSKMMGASLDVATRQSNIDARRNSFANKIENAMAEFGLTLDMDDVWVAIGLEYAPAPTPQPVAAPVRFTAAGPSLTAREEARKIMASSPVGSNIKPTTAMLKDNFKSGLEKAGLRKVNHKAVGLLVSRLKEKVPAVDTVEGRAVLEILFPTMLHAAAAQFPDLMMGRAATVAKLADRCNEVAMTDGAGVVLDLVEEHMKPVLMEFVGEAMGLLDKIDAEDKLEITEGEPAKNEEEALRRAASERAAVLAGKAL